ncbi:hypothetical protein Sste5346_001299 [Sporothrix stenoceras]|uniref:Tetratricopeptide repeat protein 1 n=1 Tax=Sporothrix stenoceras TaxID=5173 RepID=A0ABR3ZR96_9PEZI
MAEDKAPTVDGTNGENKEPVEAVGNNEKEAEDNQEDHDHEEDIERFPPDQEAGLLAEANEHKKEANELFKKSQADGALTAYETAVAILPSYLYYDFALLKSNMAACYIKMSDWKEANRTATEALDALDKEVKRIEKEKANPKKEVLANGDLVDDDDDTSVEEEIISEGAKHAARPPPPPKEPTPPPKPVGPTDQDILRIRSKILLRRGRARSELGGWANLAGAEEDYKALSAMPAGTLPATDVQLVKKQLKDLPARTNEAKDAEMGDMMGKLKEVSYFQPV